MPLPTAGERREPNSNQASTAGAEPGVGAGSGADASRPAEVRSAAAGPADVDGTSCDDGDPCTFDDQLHAGTCVGKALHCDDDNPLTVDSCTGDGCLHAFVPEAFDAR